MQKFNENFNFKFFLGLPAVPKNVSITALEEVDNLKAKCEFIKTKADYQVQKCEKTIKAYEEFDKLTKAFENWVDDIEKKLKNITKDSDLSQAPTWDEKSEKLKVRLFFFYILLI